ncbi:MAG: AIPR family protein [Gemmatimonadetes bacterium]|nr:AIPR family protein [Caldilineaceae bacterium SB0665_bin_25]MYG35695.1 AIPR family protein [Gemmatimonadota bacterium]
MLTDTARFDEYLGILKNRVNQASLELAESADQVAPLGFRENAFTAVALEILEDLGQLQDVELCYLDRRFGRAIGKCNAWGFDKEARQLHVVTTIFNGAEPPGSVNATTLTTAANRAVRVVQEARRVQHERMEPASPTFEMMRRFHELQAEVGRLQVVVITDGIAASLRSPDLGTEELEVTLDVWDIQRLYRAESSGRLYEPIEIDLQGRLGAPLPCLAIPDNGADYTSYLAILPADLLHDLYHEFGARLLELNVRSFLQARGKVNRGIRDTLRKEPKRFLAYNNGISATAESVDLTPMARGVGLRTITGLQVVNGGQTVASIHRARDRDGQDLSDVSVQAKITIVRPENIEDLVPKISRFANTQNRVNESDFSANHPFHVRIQQLSETVWAPGEQQRWFYERARGQYQVARAREGKTPAKKKRFDQMAPARQRFDKVLLAKFVNTWARLPHVVSRGAQKNFVHFMGRLAKQHPGLWEPDDEYYKDLIARAIIFKRAEKCARQHKFPAYRANAVTYTVALLSFRTAGRVDLSRIWAEQDCSAAVGATLYEWMPLVYDEIVESAGQRNVTEWCKAEDCWRHLQTLNVSVPKRLEEELAQGQPLPTVGDRRQRRGFGLSAEDRENIAHVMQVTPEGWLYLVGWGSRSQNLRGWQIGIATTLAGYAAASWTKVPSQKQAKQGNEILRVAEQHRAWPMPDDE